MAVSPEDPIAFRLPLPFIKPQHFKSPTLFFLTVADFFLTRGGMKAYLRSATKASGLETTSLPCPPGCLCPREAAGRGKQQSAINACAHSSKSCWRETPIRPQIPAVWVRSSQVSGARALFPSWLLGFFLQENTCPFSLLLSKWSNLFTSLY